VADPVSEFERYRDELMAMLGDREPLAVLQASLDEVTGVVEAAGPERLGRTHGPGEWSPQQVLNHLADSDLVAATRIRMILTQARPLIVGYDQDAWTARFGGLDASPAETLARWRVLRQTNLRLFRSLSAAEWERIGLHSERGEESVRLLVELLAGHDLIHLAQLRRGLETPAPAR